MLVIISKYARMNLYIMSIRKMCITGYDMQSTGYDIRIGRIGFLYYDVPRFNALR